MAVDPVSAALVGGGFGLLGGYLHDQSQEEINRRNIEAQREFAQMGIRWKVADAQAAGVHPLYAIGSSGASFSPSFQAGGGLARGLSEMGQDISRAMLAQKTQEERDAHEMQMALVAAQIGESDARAAYYRSQASRDAQQRQQSSPFPSDSVLGQGTGGGAGQGVNIPMIKRNAPGNVGAIQMQGDPDYSTRHGDPSTGASQRPFWSKYSISPYGLTADLPWTQEGPGEALENVPWWALPLVVGRNVFQDPEDWTHWLDRTYQEVILGKGRQYRQAPSRVSPNAPGRRRFTSDDWTYDWVEP